MEAVKIYQTQYALTDKIWNYFSAVTLAVLVFSVGGKSIVSGPLDASVIGAGYAVFAFCNHYALKKAQEELVGMAQAVNRLSAAADFSLVHLNPFSVNRVRWSQGSLAFLVAVGVAYLVWSERGQSPASAQGKCGTECLCPVPGDAPEVLVSICRWLTSSSAPSSPSARSIPAATSISPRAWTPSWRTSSARAPPCSSRYPGCG